MKNIFTGIFLLVSACFMQAQTPNYYRNPDKIYLDSKEGHNGSFTWQMHKADETKDPAEKNLTTRLSDRKMDAGNRSGYGPEFPCPQQGRIRSLIMA